MTLGGFLFVLAELLLLAPFCRREGGFVFAQFDKDETLILRGILVSLVVLGHAAAMVGAPIVSWATPAVSMFFFISGYGLVRSYEGAEKDGRDYLHGFIVRSICKLLVPLVAITVAHQLYLAAVGRFKPDFLTQFWKVGTTPLPFSWYVYSVFVMYVFFWISWRIMPRRFRVALVFALTMTYLLIVHCILRWPWFWKMTVMAFPIGVSFATRENAVQRVLAAHRCLLYCGAGVVMCAWAFIGQVYGLKSVAVPLWLVGPLMVSVLYVHPLKKNVVLSFLGGSSYEIYLIHGAIAFELTHAKLSPCMYIPTLCLLSVLAGALLHWVNVQYQRVVGRR